MLVALPGFDVSMMVVVVDAVVGGASFVSSALRRAWKSLAVSHKM